MGISRRQVFRLLKRFRTHGADGLRSKKRGKPSNRRLPSSYREAVLGLVREHFLDFGPTLASEKLLEMHGVSVNPKTLRLWMIDDGIWLPRALRRQRAYQPRNRRENLGELIQIDGSDHHWFEDRAPRCTLLVYIDDATSQLMHLKFVESESTFSYLVATREYLEKHGRPIALYSDKHSVFRVSGSSQTSTSGLTQFGRAMDDINVDIICANSSQAKGRVERVNRTLQDRLVKELRLRGLSSVEQANRYLPEYVCKHNAKFAISPKNDANLHRDIDDASRLDEAFSFQVERRVSKNLTVQYNRMMFLLAPKNGDCKRAAGNLVMVHDYPDGRLEIRYEGLSLPYTVFDKDGIVGPAAVVENKRLGPVLATIREQQKQRAVPAPPKTGPRRKEQAGGIFKDRELAKHTFLIEPPASLSDGIDRSSCRTAYRRISKALTVQHRYIRYTLAKPSDGTDIVGCQVTLYEHTDGAVELALDGKLLDYRKTVIGKPSSRADGREFVRRR